MGAAGDQRGIRRKYRARRIHSDLDPRPGQFTVETMKRNSAVFAAFLLLASFAACNAGGLGEQSRSAEAPATQSDRGGKSRGEDPRPVIAALGDSLTAGSGVDPSESYPAKIQRKIDEAGLKYRVVNAGVSGDTSAQGLNRLPAIRRLAPAVVIVALGGNDGLRGIPVETTRRNLDRIVTALRSDGALVILGGMRMPPNYGPQYTASFHNMYLELAKEHDIPLIPFLLEGVGGVPRLNQSDGIHPTAEGYDIVAATVWKVLRPVLE